ncbi:hypothetical protein [Streptomyces gobitricini]|uniref:Uncharacterized protein n=1 Tax=Streptomyces gobitricini TaxID=68211 RepID=A0ABN3LJP5_9ACTN
MGQTPALHSGHSASPVPPRTAAGWLSAARAPSSHWQETYAGSSLERPFLPLLFVFAPAPRRAATETREAAFHDRARPIGRIAVATTTLSQLTEHGTKRPVWRVAGQGENRRPMAALPAPR